MAHGGAREGAGRKAGSSTTKTREIADKAASEGVTPLEYLLSVMRDEGVDEAKRLDAAKSAAPYIHPRLATIDANVKADVTSRVEKIVREYIDPPNTDR